MCEIGGVNRQTRDKWADEGLLGKRDDYDQLDLLELVVLKLLLGTLRKKDAKIAWSTIRPKLRELMPGQSLTLVWDAQRRTAELALAHEEIAPLVLHGRPVQVVNLGTAIHEARSAFRRELDVVAERHNTLRPARRATRARRSS